MRTCGRSKRCLGDAGRRGIAEFVDLGDVLYGPLEPLLTYERLRTVNLLAGVQGNQDRLIYDATADSLTSNPTLGFVSTNLGRSQSSGCAAFLGLPYSRTNYFSSTARPQATPPTYWKT